MYEFKLPDVGEGLHEAEIGDWLVREGDTVRQDQPILEVETDKSVVELPAPIAGVIKQIAIPSGTLATVGDLLVVIEPLGRPKRETTTNDQRQTTINQSTNQPINQSTIGIPPAGQRILASPVARKMALELGVDLTQVQGSGPAGRIMTADVQAAEQAGTINDQRQTMDDKVPNQPISRSANGKVLAAPAIRKMAQEEGVDLALVSGSGENGRITLPDLQTYLATQSEKKSSIVNRQSSIANSQSTNQPINRQPLRGLRRTIARRMTQAWQIPQVTSFEEVDATELVSLRSVLKETAVSQNVRFTYMPLLIKIVLHALKAFPKFNATLDMEAEEVLLHGDYHIGVAAATDAGLLVPVLRHADRLTLLETAQELTRLGEAAKARTLTSAEAGGSTFTISNFGSYGGSVGTPILNPPEAAILGVGRLEKKAIVLDDDQIAVRTMLPLALTFDHRLIDGADSGAFLAHLRTLLEAPQSLFLTMR